MTPQQAESLRQFAEMFLDEFLDPAWDHDLTIPWDRELVIQEAIRLGLLVKRDNGSYGQRAPFVEHSAL